MDPGSSSCLWELLLSSPAPTRAVFVSPPVGCDGQSDRQTVTSPATQTPGMQPKHSWDVTGYHWYLRFPKLGIVCGWELCKSLIRT